jgi:hypothetical protein
MSRKLVFRALVGQWQSIVLGSEAPANCIRHTFGPWDSTIVHSDTI